VELVDLRVGDGDHPVEAILARTAGAHRGEPFTVRARFVVGCDGARSGVRRAIGLELHGDAANHAWGVIDVLATTDFPDWRTKNVVQSAGKGSLIMIPREGGNMVRLYVDLGEVSAGNSRIRETSVEQITAIANDILSPFSFEPKSVAWSSVYEVGQRLADRFDDVATGDESGMPRVFIAGDACHTHSAKAGQGMNVAMQDAFNLGWKLGAVLRGASDPSLLRTYTEERQRVAAQLIEFDRFWSAFVAQPVLDPERPELGGVSSADMRTEFARQSRYTAGVATRYPASTLTGSDDHQSSATGFEIGTRFHSAPVVRVADARHMELGHAHRADGRWRIYAFADEARVRLTALGSWLLAAADSPIRRFTPADGDIDSIIDVHAVLRDDSHDIELRELPPIFLPTSGSLGLQDWEKVWSRWPSANIFQLRGIAKEGAMVIVRPDQYVAHVLPLDARAELTEYFGRVLVDASAGRTG
jgi:phenol 2-monooxygenase